MLSVYPSSKTLATRSGWLDQLRLTVDNLASHQVKHSDSLWSPGCSLIFVYMFLWCSFCSIIVKRRNSYAYESPAQRNHFSFFFMPGEYGEGRPVVGLGFWAHFLVGWAWDLRQVALKQIGWTITAGQNTNNDEGIVWKWHDLNEDGWKPRVCPLWLLLVGPVEMDVETPELKVGWSVHSMFFVDFYNCY